MRQMRTQSELPEITDAIRAAGSVALDLETYGPCKGDGLDPSLLYTWPMGHMAMKLRLDASPCVAMTQPCASFQQHV